MAFINTPLGAAGYSPTVLPDMTAGIQALQRTEIERELQDIKQNKQWERDDRLRNQALALQFADTGTYDSLRQSQIEAFVNRRNEYEKKAASFFGSGIPSTSPEYTKGLVELQREKQALINETMKEKAFSDAYSDLQGKFPAQYKSLETQEQKDQFNKQIADFVLKMKDPKQKVEVYDMIQAFTPPEAPASYELSKISKELVPLVDKAIMRDANGRTQIDEAAALKTIGANLAPQSYLFEKGVREGLWKSPEEMNMQVLDRIRTSIGINPVGWRPKEGGAAAEKDKVQEVPTYVESSDPTIKSGEGVVLPKAGRPFNVTIGEGDERTSASFTPTQYVDGVMQGRFTGVKYVKRAGVDAGQARRDASMDSRIKVTNIRKDGDKMVADAVYPEIDTWYGSVPYSQIRDEVKDRFPTVESKYQEDISSKTAKQVQQQSTNPNNSVIPEYTREFLRSQGYSDKKIDQAVKDNKIKLK